MAKAEGENAGGQDLSGPMAYIKGAKFSDQSEDAHITIEQFVNREIKRLTQFRKAWKANQATSPDDYPVTMTEAEWAEHYGVATEVGTKT